MQDLNGLKLFSALFLLLLALFAGWYPFIKKGKSKKVFEFPIGEAFASGVFLGAGLIHMLGDAARNFVKLGYPSPIPFLLAGLMFLFLLWLEHLSRELYEHEGGASTSFAIMAVILLSIHSLLEGAALGLSLNLSFFFVILIAIVAHKWAASFALAIQINKSTLKTKPAILYFLLFAFSSPMGVLLGGAVTDQLATFTLLAPIFTALAAGTFLYLGTLHGLKQSVMISRCCNLKHFSFVILGFVVMAIASFWT